VGGGVWKSPLTPLFQRGEMVGLPELIEKLQIIRQLPPEQQREVRDFAEFLLLKQPPRGAADPNLPGPVFQRRPVKADPQR